MPLLPSNRKTRLLALPINLVELLAKKINENMCQIRKMVVVQSNAASSTRQVIRVLKNLQKPMQQHKTPNHQTGKHIRNYLAAKY